MNPNSTVSHSRSPVSSHRFVILIAVWLLICARLHAQQVYPTLDFGHVDVGQTSYRNYNFVGIDPNHCVQYYNFTLTGPDAEDFSIIANSCAGLCQHNGETCTISMAFTPSAVGPRTGDLVIDWSAQPSQGLVPLQGNVVTPVIAGVTRAYDGTFIEGTPVNDRFDVAVIWNGEPGLVRFVVNDTTIANESGTPFGASHTFNLASDFVPSFTPIEMRIIAINAEGRESLPRTEDICLVPLPNWLTAGSVGSGNAQFQFIVTPDDVKTEFSFDFPVPHLGADDEVNTIPSWVPFLGGRFGFAESYFRVKGGTSSRTLTSSAGLEGQLGFTAGDHSITGNLSGVGNLRLECQGHGLSLESGTFTFNLADTIRIEKNLSAVIPELTVLEHLPIIGATVKWLDDHLTFQAHIKPSVGFSGTIGQNEAGDLILSDSTIPLSLELTATVKAVIVKGLSARGWATGSGNCNLGVPHPPWFRDFGFAGEAGVEFTFEQIFGLTTLAKQVDFACTKMPPSPLTCGLSESLAIGDGNAVETAAYTITRDYARFGDYARFSAGPGAVPGAGATTTLVSNIFPGASPFTIELNDGSQLLLWAHADPSLPVTQSTGIMWSLQDGQGNWSEPQLIAQDTRAEFSPVAGSDANGKILAAWLRVKEIDFPPSIETLEDVARFFKDYEVVTAEFDPKSRTWSKVAALTDDSAFDTDLELSSDGSGGLMLSWLSNPDAELMSTAKSPSTLKYCIRSGKNWTPPAVVAGPLAGINHHAAAVRGQNACIILPVDPNLGSDPGSALYLLRFMKGAWTTQGFASGEVDNRLPSLAYDNAGVAHVVWVRGDDLVNATVDDPTPRLVRADSAGLGVYDGRLVANHHGNLVFVYRESADNGATAIFGTIYDPPTSSWSKERQLIRDRRELTGVSGFFDHDDNLRLAHLATEILRTTRTVTINGQEQTIENIPEEGQTDLNTTVVTGSSLTTSVLANISTRLRVGTGDNVLVGGFIVTGTEPKKVIVRAIGPSLPFADALGDPILELRDSSGTLLESNDNWVESSNTQAIIDTAISPSDPLESAIVRTVNPGFYTAVMRGVDEGTGVGVVEVYDLDTFSSSKLANISTRGFVDAGDNVMIGGMIVTGSAHANVLIRAIGPSLANVGIQNALQDPTLELHNGDGDLISSNDDWKDTQQTAIKATGIPPTNDKESAILSALSPGNYTAIVRGKNDGVGVGLVEVYNLQ